jgi:hypothetical protein
MPLMVKAELFSPGSKSMISHRPTDWLIIPAAGLARRPSRGRVHFATCWAAGGVLMASARCRFGGFTQSIHESTEIAVFLMH